MTADWVTAIADVLDTCDIPQVRTALIQEFYDQDNNLVVGKCAMGVLSCEAGMTLTPEMNSDLVNNNENYHNILKLYNVPEEFWGNKLLPELYSDGWEHEIDEYNNPDLEDYSNRLVEFHAFVFRMNDNGMTFKEIAECIRVTFADVE